MSKECKFTKGPGVGGEDYHVSMDCEVEVCDFCCKYDCECDYE